MRHSKTAGWAPLLVAVVLSALAPGLARAAEVSFLDVTDPNPVGVLHTGFDCGATFTVAGETAHFEGCWTTTSPVGYSGAGYAIQVEPSFDAFPFTVSDSIHVQFFTVTGQAGGANEAHIIIDFYSLPTGAPHYFPPAGFPRLEEDGTLQLLNGFFVNEAAPAPPFSPLAPPQGILIYAQSDAGSATSVPSTTWGKLKMIYR